MTPTTDIEQAIARGHPASNLFPMLGDAELWELTEDIRKNGLLEPIEVHEGLILDGRNRWVACLRAGVAPRTVTWDGRGGSPTACVISKNLHRRHLTPSQRAAVAAEALPLFEDEAKVRQLATLKRGDEPPVPAIVPEREKGAAREHAAAQFDVSPRYVQDAKRLRNEAPDTFDQVKAGGLTLSEAMRRRPDLDWSPPAAPSPAERAFGGLGRQIAAVVVDPQAAAALSRHPAEDAERVERYGRWALDVARALRGLAADPIRLVSAQEATDG